jgi:hypothetical protein
VVTDTLTHTDYITVSAGIGYTTTARVITYPYECAASLKWGETDKFYPSPEVGCRCRALIYQRRQERLA